MHPETRPFLDSQGPRRLRIFISYASEDRERALGVDRWLLEKGYDAWFDTERLLPGQDWHREVRRAVRSSDVVLMCISVRSTSKEGYIQREIRQVLEVADEKPPGTIFIIPIRLDRECELAEELRRLQWLSCPPNVCGICAENLLASLKIRETELRCQPAADSGHDGLAKEISEIRRALLLGPSGWELRELLHRCEWLAKQYSSDRAVSEIMVLRDQIQHSLRWLEAPPAMEAPARYAPLPAWRRLPSWSWSLALIASLGWVLAVLLFLIGRPTLSVCAAAVSLTALWASSRALGPVARLSVFAVATAVTLLVYNRLPRPYVAGRVQPSAIGLEITISNKGAARARSILATARARSDGRRGDFVRTYPIQDLSPGDSVSRLITFDNWPLGERSRPTRSPSVISSTVVIECSTCEPVILSGTHVTAPGEGGAPESDQQTHNGAGPVKTP
jgi:hypothetical protein